MKTGLLCFAAFSLLELAAAQPHRRRHQHAKRDVVTQIEYVTATGPDAIVYVDQDGNVLSTSYANQAPPTSAPSAYAAPTAPSVEAPSPSSTAETEAAPVESSAPAPAPVESSAAAPAPVKSSAPAPPAYTPPPQSSAAPVAPSSAAPSSAAQPSASPAPESTSGGMGISYAPYNADGTCKTQDQVSSDFEKLKGYSIVRTYGVDCNQATTVLNAAKANGQKLFIGIFDVTQVASAVQTIVSANKAANDNWASIDTVSVGNELVNTKQATVGAVVDAVNTARRLLRAAGYNGPVVTVDTFNAIIDNPDLCGASDYAAANCHAFFDPNTPASDAGAFVAKQAKAVAEACKGKRTVITESGWPTQGGSNGVAVPSAANQKAALDSLRGEFSDGLILFSAFNDLWKKDNAGTFGCEKFWGIHG